MSQWRSKIRARLAFGLVCWLFLELAAYLGLAFLDGDPNVWAVSRKEARRWLRSARVASGLMESEEKRNVPNWAEQKRAHPYLGAAPLRYDEAFRPLPKRAPEQLVVGLFGGSVALQIAKDGKDQLSRGLAEIYGVRTVQLVNLTGGGFKQPQQLIALCYLLAQGGELDLAISLDGFNEVAMHGVRNEPDGVWPAYPFAWRSRATSALTATMASALGRSEGLRQQLQSCAEAALGPVAGFLPSAQLLYRLRLESLGSRWTAATAEVDEIPVVVGPRFFGDPYPMLVEVWFDSTLQMQRMCQANGIAFYDFLQPNQYAPVSKPMGPEESALALNPKHECKKGAETGYPLLIAAGPRLLAEGVSFTDLTGLFGATHEPVYTDDCCHFNALGIKMLVEAMLKRISSDRNRSEGKGRGGQRNPKR
jgi:hypothetical protein